MGYSRWSADSWSTYSSTTSTKTAKEIFKSVSMDPALNPLGVTMRESRDSALNPESTPIIIGVDVTGSMGKLAELIVKEGLGTLFEEILNRKPVTDPQLMSMAIGDAVYDTAPLQVSQFEADLTAATWLEKIYVERGGGGNNYESYDLPYYFAAFHTSHDAFEKRGKKGYLFTVGDEQAPTHTTLASIKKCIEVDGDGVQADMPFADVIEAASKMYHVFHIIIAEGSYAKSRPDLVKRSWAEVMGQNVIWLEDYTKLAETIVSVIEVTNGADKETVAKSWSGSTAMVVADAIKDIAVVDAFEAGKSVVRFDGE